MLSTGFVKMYFTMAVLQVFLGWNLVLPSSIYVGRHEAGKISEHGPSAVSEVHTCEDGNRRLCRRVINFYGKEHACNSHDRDLLYTVQTACQATCGFCTSQQTNPECEEHLEDQYDDLCREYKDFCDASGDIGALVKDICPKTCRVCNGRPSSEGNNVVIIHG